MSAALAPGKDAYRRSCGAWPKHARGGQSLSARNSTIGEFNQRFSVAASERGTAFVPLRRKDLDLVFSLQHERVVSSRQHGQFRQQSVATGTK